MLEWGRAMKTLPNNAKKARMSGYALGVAAAVSYASNAFFSLPLLKGGVGVSSVLFWRYLPAVLLYALLTAGVKRQSLRLPRAAVLPLALLSLLFCGSALALYSAFLYIDGGLAMTILFVYPAMVTLLSVCFFGEQVSVRLLAALAASGAGVALLYGWGSGAVLDWRGVGLALLSAACYALYILGVRHIRPVKGLRAELLTFYIMLFGLLLFSARLAVGGAMQVPEGALQWGCVCALALVPTIVALETFTRSLRLIGAVKAAILCSLEPPVAILLGVCFYGEALTLRCIIGAALILSGVLAVLRR